MKKLIYQLGLFCLALSTCLMGSELAYGVEIYSLFDKDCQVRSGAIVHVDDDVVTLLQLNGNLTSLPLAKVKLIARYDLLENPFPSIDTQTAGAYRHAVATETDDGSFDAFATNFYEDLVLFLDKAGKIRVVEIDNIVSLKQPQANLIKEKIAYQPTVLISPPGREHCPTQVSPERMNVRRSEQAATQVMADQLRIDSFWSRMRRGYLDLTSLRERTAFYAKPILFDQKTRLGIPVERSNLTDVIPVKSSELQQLPLYLEFGSGAAYRFQSSTTMGTKSLRMVPQLRPQSALRSEFKSHLLHGMFAANFRGFTAGAPVFLYAWDTEQQAKIGRKAPWTISSFNHLTLLGADYGNWSISYGYYFPSIVFGQGDEFREVTATKTSPVFRLAYIKSRWQVELFTFFTKVRAENGVKFRDLVDPDQLRNSDLSVRYYSDQMIPLRYRLNSNSARLSSKFSVTSELEFNADFVATKTTYAEHSLRRDEALDPTRFNERSDTIAGTELTRHVDHTAYGLRSGARMDIGQWVAVGAEAYYEYQLTNGSLSPDVNASDVKKSDQLYSYSVVMELLL